MNLVNEYALLFAVALPVVVIVGIQVALFIAGERGTGLIPGLGKYPSVDFGKVIEVSERSPMVSQVPTVATDIAAGNDESERMAA